MRMTIASDVARQLVELAARSDDEICGLVRGAMGHIDGLAPATNVSSHPNDSFEIDPRALFGAARARRDGVDRTIGHYHSHPEGCAEPSARDVAGISADGEVWLIVAGGQLTAWVGRINGGERRFDVIDLVVVP